MLVIDGSQGEGGGQVLRTCLSLSGRRGSIRPRALLVSSSPSGGNCALVRRLRSSPRCRPQWRFASSRRSSPRSGGSETGVSPCHSRLARPRKRPPRGRGERARDGSRQRIRRARGARRRRSPKASPGKWGAISCCERRGFDSREAACSLESAPGEGRDRSLRPASAVTLDELLAGRDGLLHLHASEPGA
jgi:hypothetical protein